MSRILRRPMFRGGSPNNGGIMSYAQPRRNYGDSYLYGVGNENSTDLNTTTGFEDLLGNSDRASSLTYSTGLSQNDLETSKDEGTINRGILSKKLKEAEAADELGLSPMGKRLRDRYLSQRSDPMSKFLINFGLNYMSARPRGGKFGAITTAAEAAKKPTEQLYADQDTEAALELKLLSAFGKEKDTDLTRLAKAWSERPENKGKTEQDFLGELAKQRLENKDLRDFSDAALIRKYGEEWSKSQRIKEDPLSAKNAGIYKLKVEKGEIPDAIIDLLEPGNNYIATGITKKNKDNPNILEFNSKTSTSDKDAYSPDYVYVNPSDKGFYQIKSISGKTVFVKIGKY
jgi:hypothetical protein